MKHVIHQKHYSYDDEYITKDGRSVHSVKHFSSERDAKKAWIAFEKQYVRYDKNGKAYFTLGIEPIEIYDSNFDSYEYIFNF